MKRLLIFLLCSILIFSSLSFAATAADTEIIEEGAGEETVGIAADKELADTGADAELTELAAEDELASTGWSLVTEAQFQTKLSALRVKYPHGSIWEGIYYENGSAKASTCWAYAAQMLKEVFGVNFYADGMLSYKSYDSGGVTAGDWVRIDYDSHSIFITKVTDKGVEFTDGNGTGVYNQVRWDGFYSWSEFTNRFSYRLHLPGNTLTGQGLVHTIAYDSNGGTGTMSLTTVAPGAGFTIEKNVFSREGFTFAGYTVRRSSDDKWFTKGGNGWQTYSAITANGYNFSIYQPGENYKMSTNWLGSTTTPTTFTFYANWVPNPSSITYNANGGTGSMSSDSAPYNEGFTVRENEFSRPGYTFAGYTVKRNFDNVWYTDNGWKTQTDIYNNGCTYSIYQPGENYTMSANWLGNSFTGSFTFYAQWLPDTAEVEYFNNYSGYNYILGSDLSSGYGDYIFSRDTSNYSVSVDTAERLNNANSLKITGKKAGYSGSDLAVITSTNYGYGNGYSPAGLVGDEKDLTLHFYAKASVSGAKMYIRWGYSTEYTTVSLTTDWAVYTVSMPKNRYFGYAMHPYFDKAGTYYINSLALGDMSFTSNVVPETQNTAYSVQSVTRGGKLGSMPTPKRSGYTFEGWYTSAEGGYRVTSDTTINESTIRLYVHWTKNVSETPVMAIRYNGHVYALYENAMGWEEANEFCREQGGHLITISDRIENMLASDMIRGRQGYCWIGLRYKIGRAHV